MSSQHQERAVSLHLFLSKAELAAVEEFRFDERLPTTSAALRELMRRGLLAFASAAPNKLH